MRTHELKAFIIFIKPPSAERLRETRQEAVITTDYYANRPFKVRAFSSITTDYYANRPFKLRAFGITTD